MSILTIDHLYKSFGSHAVIADLSLSVPEHSAFGFLGQNGAGKTTTMKMILGLLKQDQGTIRVCGEPVSYGQTKTNRLIGYLPDVPVYYSYMTPREYLRLCGAITGMPKHKIRQRSDELLNLVGLEQVKKRIGGFSRGMKQRLGIAQALLGEPRLLICDEPTSALDPVGRREILNILQQIKGKTTVFFSTHILSDAERICDQVAVLHQGKAVLQGTIEEMRGKYRQDRLLLIFKSEEDCRRFCMIKGLDTFVRTAKLFENRKVVIESEKLARMEAAVIAGLQTSGILPLKMEILEPTLETLFMEVVE